MTSSTSAAVASAIRAEMARRKLSQRHIAQHLGLSHASIWRRLNGQQPWDVDELDSLAKLFEMDARDLLPTATVAP